MIDGTIPVIVNREGGQASTAGDRLVDEIVDAFAAAGQRIDLQLVDGDDLAEQVRLARGRPLVVVGGGDGSIGSAAPILAGTYSTLGILPLGTRNHLARALGIPAGIEDAARTTVTGAVRRIDVASVNGIGFVNNVSIGFYPLLVRWRDSEFRRRGIPKWLATIPAVWAALRRLPHHRMRILSGKEVHAVVTPLLFVGNNVYTLERGHIGERLALDDGKLSIFAVAPSSRASLVWFALRTLAGRSDPQHDFAALGDSDGFIVHSRSETIDVAIDGEPRRMRTPLIFSVDRAALGVRVPG